MIPRLLVVQRVSLSHGKLKSRSIGARFGPLLNYMARHQLITWEFILETDITLKDFQRFDAVLVNKHSSRKGVEIIQNANAMGLKTIYDMDDWILDLPSYSVTNLDDDILSNIVRMLKDVDVVTVSTQSLKERLKFLRPDASLLGNGFDHHAIFYQHTERVETKPPKILFSNTDGIKLIAHRAQFFKHLVNFQEKHPEVEIDFWGDEFPEMTMIPRLNDKGFLDNVAYKQSIRDAGYLFALVPLGGKEDDQTFQFNACKSCIKFIDYGSLGIPGVYSNTPVYSQVVEDGVTGLLVDNEGDHWRGALEKMYGNAHLRQQISDQAYQYAVQHFGLDKVASIFLRALSEV